MRRERLTGHEVEAGCPALRLDLVTRRAGLDDDEAIPICPTVTLMQYDRDLVVAAIRSWYARHGRPPSQTNWDALAPEQPSARTIARRWGWSSVVRVVVGDKEPGAGRQGSSWSRREMLEALIEAFAENGAWPSGRSWERTSAMHPARRTYVRLFGSWRRAVDAAAAEVVERRGVGLSRRLDRSPAG
jgi:hypothetical protein